MLLHLSICSDIMVAIDCKGVLTMIDLSVEYAGLKLRTPVIAASSGITETVELMKNLEQHGIGAIVMKSLFEEEICRQAPTPRYKVLRHDMGGKYRTFSFYSYEQASVWGPDRYAQEVKKAVNELSIPIIPSINCITDDGWKRYAALMQKAGAPALELNVSCPHGSIVFRGGTDVASEIIRVTELVLNEVDIPVIVKLSPQLTAPLQIAKAVENAGVKGVVMFNRLTGLDIDIDAESPILHGGYAGHGGPWAIYYALKWISEAYPQLHVDISASGGAVTADDVVKYILAGAKTVQVCTAIMLKGPGVIDDMNGGLAAWMNKKGYNAVDQFRGKVSNGAIKGTKDVDRRHYKKAHILDKCTSCGICAPLCIFDAIDSSTEPYRVVQDICDGCGLCAEVCPISAVEMREV